LLRSVTGDEPQKFWLVDPVNRKKKEKDKWTGQ
jgi:hypothetical protein